jgi:translation initiation factor eIF-2B subunit beta
LNEIVATNAILANGGIVCYTGAHMMCIAAHEYAKPVIVISGVFKQTPLHGFEASSENNLHSPLSIYIPRNEDDQSNIDVCVPAHDYVPPDLISLYITDMGPYTPMNIDCLLPDMYSQEDYSFGV